MRPLVDSIRLGWGALLLRREAYGEVRKAPNPFVTGLTVLIVISVLVSILMIVGELLAWATSPSVTAMREVVWQNMQRMPWYRAVGDNNALLQEIRRWYNTSWQFFPRFFGAADPIGAGINVITRPVSLFLLWLLYGVLAHVIARILGGRAPLMQTLGTTALAVAPQLLHVVQILPYVRIGSVLTVWTLVCAYVALKDTHDLTWARTFWATVLPLFLLALLSAALVSALVALAASVLG